MLPPIEKENIETDMDSDASDDMKDGLVHHLQRRLLNSTCDWSLLDEGNKQKSVQPWPTIFTRPHITHFERKNSRPDIYHTKR